MLAIRCHSQQSHSTMTPSPGRIPWWQIPCWAARRWSPCWLPWRKARKNANLGKPSQMTDVTFNKCTLVCLKMDEHVHREHDGKRCFFCICSNKTTSESANFWGNQFQTPAEGSEMVWEILPFLPEAGVWWKWLLSQLLGPIVKGVTNSSFFFFRILSVFTL